MSINYTELQARIIDWSNRTDLSARIPEFIALAESEIRRRITTKKQAVRAMIQCVNGQDLYCLPDDYKAMRDIKVNYNGQSMSLRNAAPTTVNALTTPTVPLFYTDIAQQLQLIPPPNSDDYVIEMVYYQDLPSLADQDDGTNWLLIQDEDVYLNGAMKYPVSYTHLTLPTKA